MTSLLETAYQKASAFPAHLQDMVARELLQEIEWEYKWDKTLENSQPALNELTARAMKKYGDGKTVEKGFNEL